ncbi:MAG TPA: alkaline phosphatase family protein [Polyangiaceae bacterium]
MHRIGARVALLAVAFAACGSPPIVHAPGARSDTKHAPVVVTLVVDQLAAWMAEERFPELPEDGGFARLRREGTWYQDMRFEHAVTETAPGHSALYTGMVPGVSGIFANELVDPSTHKRVSILRDATTKEVLASGAVDDDGASLAALDVYTLADRLRAQRPDADIVSLSLKDRGAIFGGGRAPDAVLWFDTKRDVFTTSTAFATRFPAWAAEVKAPPRDPWVLLDAPWVEKHAASPDAQPGEGDLGGFGITFPHAFSAAKEPAGAFRASPRGDDALLALAVAAVAQHAVARPMLLAVSLSSHDYVMHVFGPDSWEAWDELRRLDASLAGFFRVLDARFGKDGWSALLAGDHGDAAIPEVGADKHAWCTHPDPWERPCPTKGRIVQDELAAKASKAAKEAMGDVEWVLGFASPYLFLSDAAARLPPEARARLEAAVTRALLEYPGVARVVRRREELRCDAGGVDALLCNSLSPKAKDALYVLPMQDYFFDSNLAVGKGNSHGGPYLYDRSVPLLVRGGTARPGAVVTHPVAFTMFAQNASALLGIHSP